jgi:OFA family oxalate/formate antiporter-like MFS transporter
VQLTAGIVAMVAVANFQYGWTLFVEPLRETFGWPASAIQVAFTLFVLAETWLVPVEGYVVDRIGPAPIVAAGGLLAGFGWLCNAGASTLAMLYLGSTLSGVGTGMVYGASIGNALKWFAARRGLAAGLLAGAFGAGSALTVIPIAEVINHLGFYAGFLWFGLGQGAVVFLCAMVMRPPPSRPMPDLASGVVLSQGDVTWTNMLRTPIFWLMYVMFTMVTLGGLMAVAQLGPLARHYGVDKAPVAFMFWTFQALPLALMLDRIMNGVTRPFFGWVSDHLGRENTMFLAFGLEGIAILLLLRFAHIPVLFVALTGLTFFAWGEVFSLFPALSTDVFGRKFAATNYGLLYTAKGTASLLIPLGSYLQETYGSWEPIFGLAVAFDWITALLALLALKPMIRHWRIARESKTTNRWADPPEQAARPDNTS